MNEIKEVVDDREAMLKRLEELGYKVKAKKVKEVIVLSDKEKELIKELGLSKVNYNYKKGINKGVGDMIRGFITDGLSDAEILKRVCEYYKNDNTTIKCIRWYRNDMKKK